MLATGIVLGSSLHKAAYAIGGVLAVAYLLVFVLTLDACEAVCALFDLLNISDSDSRDDILRQLNRCQKKGQTRVFPDADSDSIIQEILQEFPSRLRSNLSKAWHVGPALAAAVSLCCLLSVILLEDIPTEVCSLPAVSTSLLAVSVLLGCKVQLGTTPLVKSLVSDEIGSPPCKLLELHIFQLRRRVAATPEGFFFAVIKG